MVQEDIKKYEIKLEREKEKELEREREKELEREKEKELEREKEIIKPIVIPVKVKYDADLDYFQKVINNIRKLKETTKLEEAINKIDDKILSCIGLAV